MDMLFKDLKFTPVNNIYKKTPRIMAVGPSLGLKDRIGGILVRWSVGRNNYRVEPGLYSCNSPDRDSPVLVTANYKLTFDSVRKELAGKPGVSGKSGVSAWILVLDTKGVNVWCAAGKGTFGTDELVRQIKTTALAGIVAHRELILPQLGAPGIAAHEVTRRSRFKVRYGPVYARDIAEYLSNGKVKTEAMKRVGFTFRERLAVAPVEIAHSLPLLIGTLVLSALLALPFGPTFERQFWYSALTLSGGIFAGTVLFPALLPLLPFRAFALKGTVLGIVWTLVTVYFADKNILDGHAFDGYALNLAVISSLPLLFFTVPMVSFLSMNFTGASTYTCQKGTELEVRVGVPLMLVSVLAGIVFGVINYLGAF